MIIDISFCYVLFVFMYIGPFMYLTSEVGKGSGLDTMKKTSNLSQINIDIKEEGVTFELPYMSMIASEDIVI